MKTIGVQELSEYLHKTPGTIREYRRLHPEYLPPLLNIPGKILLWEEDVVIAWMRGELK